MVELCWLLFARLIIRAVLNVPAEALLILPETFLAVGRIGLIKQQLVSNFHFLGSLVKAPCFSIVLTLHQYCTVNN